MDGRIEMTIVRAKDRPPYVLESSASVGAWELTARYLPDLPDVPGIYRLSAVWRHDSNCWRVLQYERMELVPCRNKVSLV